MAAILHIATKNATFGQPETKLRIIHGFGSTQRLARLIGKGCVLELCLTGRLIKSSEALQIRLINELPPENSLIKRANELLTTLIALPSVALKCLYRNCTSRI